jgi:hypothetical protein
MRNIDSNQHLARRIKRKGPIFVRGYFPTTKNQNSLYFESFLELAALLHYENDATIVFMNSQPSSVSLIIGNRKTRYSPDLMLMRVTGEIIYIEVKPADKLSEPKTEKRHNAIEHALKKLDREFLTFSNEDISRERLTNLELLYQGASVYNDIKPELDEALSTLPTTVSIGDAIQHLSSAGIHNNVLHYLLYNFYFIVDLDTPISNDSMMYSNVA